MNIDAEHTIQAKLSNKSSHCNISTFLVDSSISKVTENLQRHCKMSNHYPFCLSIARRFGTCNYMSIKFQKVTENVYVGTDAKSNQIICTTPSPLNSFPSKLEYYDIYSGRNSLPFIKPLIHFQVHFVLVMCHIKLSGCEKTLPLFCCLNQLQ